MRASGEVDVTVADRLHSPPPASERAARIHGDKLTVACLAAATLALGLAHGGYDVQTYAIGAILVWWAVIVGVALRVLPRGPLPRPAGLALVALTGLAALTAASAAWSGDVGRSVEEAVRTAGYLGILVLALLAARPGDARAWLSGITIGLTLIAVAALGSRMLPGAFPAPELAASLPSAAPRLSYPLGYWNGLGAAMAPAATLLVWFGAAAASRLVRALATAAIAPTLLALYLTSSRGGVLVLGAGLLCLLVLGPRRVQLCAGALLGLAATAVLAFVASGLEAVIDGAPVRNANTQGLTMLAVTLLAVGAVGVARYLLDGRVERLAPGPDARRVLAGAAVVLAAAGIWALDPVARIDRFSAPPTATGSGAGFVNRHLLSLDGNGRLQFWNSAIDAFQRHPAAGIGAGAFEAFWAREGSLAYFIRDAHSLPLETAAELGIGGLAMLLALVVAVALGARSRLRDAPDRGAVTAAIAVVACGAIAAAIDWTWELPAAFAPGLLAGAVLVGPALGGTARVMRGAGALRAGVLLVAAVAVAVSALVLFGETRLSASREASARNDLPAAAAAARDAAAIVPWSSKPRLQLAVVREAQGDDAGAADAVDAALRRAPDDWRAWVISARIRTRLSDPAGVARAIGEARRLNPCLALFAGPDGSACRR
jgi:hypothetical protein